MCATRGAAAARGVILAAGSAPRQCARGFWARILIADMVITPPQLWPVSFLCTACTWHKPPPYPGCTCPPPTEALVTSRLAFSPLGWWHRRQIAGQRHSCKCELLNCLAVFTEHVPAPPTPQVERSSQRDEDVVHRVYAAARMYNWELLGLTPPILLAFGAGLLVAELLNRYAAQPPAARSSLSDYRFI